jgi:hypothetical protein
MLFAGLASQSIAKRLTQLGAVPGLVHAPPRWDVDDPSIFILSETGVPAQMPWPGLHCVIATRPSPAADAVVDDTSGQIEELWTARLMPFEANLRANRRAPRRQQAVLAEPDPAWPVQARRLIARL